MKKSLLLSVVASTMIMAGGDIVPVEPVVDAAPVPAATNSFGDALKNGTFTAKMRAFYMNRTFDGQTPDETTALTAGGILKYESGDYHGFKFGLAYYGSHSLSGIVDRDEGFGTSLLERGTNEDLAFLGEAYLQYDIGNTMFKVGRQQLATPLIQNHDLRLLPSVYEAAIVRNKSLPDTMIELGYVVAYTGFTSKDNDFLDYNEKWGEDGLAYISLANKSIENLSLRAQYVYAVSDTNKVGDLIAVDDYRYIDAKYSFGNAYVKAQYGGNAYNVGEDSTLFGAKIGTTLGMFEVAALYDKISDNSFKAVESGPMYSDWQQGYGNYEPSTAFGGQLVIKPMAGLSLKFGYVDVAADEGNLRDDFTEFNFDGKYTINEWSKIRVRYSMKDQSDASNAAINGNPNGYGSAGREDRDDFRVIYYMNF